jgi:hypothetical protein
VKISELNAWVAVDPDRPVPGQRGEIDPEPGAVQHLGDDLLVWFVQPGVVQPGRGGEPPEDLGVGQRLAERLGRFHLRGQAEMEIGSDEIV